MCSTSLMTLLTVTALQLQYAERNFNPGAGIGVTDAGDKVLKDGFASVACLQDGMYEKADKYGENRHSYSNHFNVSIVRYSDVVDREEKKPMTPQVCFDFCRTIDDMHFFGLRNGRECYCTPYYHRTPGGGGVCDLPCEGDSAKMCGGQEMINMYEMHMCDSTAKDIKAAADAADTAYALANSSGIWGQSAAADFEAAADTIKLEANKVGDMISHDLAQQMKVHAGTVLHAAERAAAAASALKTELDALKGLKTNDFSLPDNVYEAEKAMRTVAKLAAKAEEDGKVSQELNVAFMPPINSDDALEGMELFVPVVEMIKRWQGDHPKLTTTEGMAVLEPTTCEGSAAAEPIVGLSIEQCAEACNTYAPSSADNYCVAFQHFYVPGLDVSPPMQVQGVEHLAQGICQLFSSVDHVYKYDCGEEHTCQDVDYKLLGIERPCNEGESGCPTRLCYAMANNPNFMSGMMWKYRNPSCGRNPKCKNRAPGSGRSFQEEWGLKDSDPGFWEGCCAVKELYPDGEHIPGLLLEKQALLSRPETGRLVEQARALLTGHPSPASHALKQENHALKKDIAGLKAKIDAGADKTHSLMHYPSDPGRVQLELQAPPKGMWGVANSCKVRASWMIAAPQKPEYEELNTCLDTGRLSMP